MGEVEEVGDGAEDGDATADEGVDLDANGAADVEEVEVEGINEEGDEAGDEEDAVPPEDNVATGIEDAPGLPWFVAVEADGDGGQRGAVEWKRRPAKGEEEPGGGGAEGAHRPRRRGEDSAAAAAMGGGATKEIKEGVGMGIGGWGWDSALDGWRARGEPRETQRFPEGVGRPIY